MGKEYDIPRGKVAGFPSQGFFYGRRARIKTISPQVGGMADEMGHHSLKKREKEKKKTSGSR